MGEVTLASAPRYARRVDAESGTPVEPELARRIAGARPGIDARAEDELCRRMAPRLRLYGLRHLRDAHAAADLAQQVLAMTLERLRAGRLRDPDMLVSFMFGLCRRVVLDMRRTQARRDELLATYADDVPVVDAGASPRLDHDRLRGCLERLTERERSVLVLSFFDDRPAADVGRELALSEGNVRVIRHRGIARLRACMEQPTEVR
ncbi:MAG: hypothetical protein BroJett026_37050 [Betaproteobacteria bacterium]|nr:MAG: hypothetical protein BroJett026_37050 [Betaproteobacteria bacterium]